MNRQALGVFFPSVLTACLLPAGSGEFAVTGERLYLIVPRQEGEEGPTIRVYQPRR